MFYLLTIALIFGRLPEMYLQALDENGFWGNFLYYYPVVIKVHIGFIKAFIIAELAVRVD
jgi:hypothetical protein